MKKSIVLVTLAGALFALAVAASANDPARLRVSVPFAFYVDGTLLPPGEYRFEMRALTPSSASSSAVLVRNQDGTVVAWVSAKPGVESRRLGEDHVHFNRYGSQYFLSKVECIDYQSNLMPSRAELEYRAATKTRDSVIVGGK